MLMLCFRVAQKKTLTPDEPNTIDEIHAILANAFLSESFDHATCIPAK